MKIIHTGDWHLGQTLGTQSRVYEHKCFFQFLNEKIFEEKPDALIVSGDIFDTASPSSESLRLYLSFLKSLKETVKWPLQVIVIAGNHDSAPRLDVHGILLELLNVKVVGKLPICDDRSPDYDNLMVPIYHDGILQAVVAAVPFLRSGDLPVEYVNAKVGEPKDRYLEGYRLIYQELLALIHKKYGDDIPVIATGHTFVSSALVSENSEVPLFCGNQQSVPADIFQGYDFAALGHLHRPQELGPKLNIVYAGSPFPFDFAEKNYRNRIVVVEESTDEDRKLKWREITVPRFVEFVDVPSTGSATIDEVLSELSSLPEHDGYLPEQYPYLAVHVLVDKSTYNLIGSIDQKLENTKYRKIKVTTEFANQFNDEANVIYQKDVRELTYDDAFKAIFKIRSPEHTEPTPEDMAVYHEIVDSCLDQVKE